MSKKVRYPVGQQSFKMLRERDCLYVDKTQYIEKLLDDGSQYYFLGRPRRFGKSLFLSTMKCFFRAERQLFKGLYADSMDWDWQPHPVLHLDLNMESYRTPGSLEDVLRSNIELWEEEFEISPRTDNLSVRFSDVIRIAYEKTGKGVVILVDEYDKPLVNNLHDSELFISFREQLTAIYSNFKNSASYIRMVFLTGVSRFAHLSVFSGLNNISYISFLDKYSAICGITEQELVENFSIGITKLAEKYRKTPEQIHGELKHRYDGYHFTKHCEDIYNPYSLLNVMEREEFGFYWVNSGFPTLLAQQLRRFDTDLRSVFGAKCFVDDLVGLDLDIPRPLALLYQTGYLTITGYDPNSELYTLDIPNNEVKQGFLNFLLPYYANFGGEKNSRFFVYEFLTELRDGDVDAFMARLQSIFAAVPYDMHMDNERNVHNALLMLMMLLGMDVQTEYKTSNGRIDLFIKTERYYYIMELKFDKSAREALDQINDRNYALPFATDGKEVIKIGINFSSESRTLTDWLAEK